MRPRDLLVFQQVKARSELDLANSESYGELWRRGQQLAPWQKEGHFLFLSLERQGDFFLDPLLFLGSAEIQP